MNNKVFLSIIIIIILGTAFWAVFSFYKSQKSQEAQKTQAPANHQMPVEKLSVQEQSCVDSGGAVTSASCCESTEDFPDNCAIGACGCAPEYSREVKFCGCGDERCFDGHKCVANEGAEKNKK